jgi:magnesium-transporting ATPase (P-type)
MFGLSNPLNAMQILFINILMDGAPFFLVDILPMLMVQRPQDPPASRLAWTPSTRR